MLLHLLTLGTVPRAQDGVVVDSLVGVIVVFGVDVEVMVRVI